VTSINAGTTSDTPTIPAGGIVADLFPANSAAEFSPISLSQSLIAGATGEAIWWGYDTYSLDNQIGQIVNCNSDPCVANIDRSIGTIYYRRVYTNSTGVIARSDVQQF
jgi:hypothetical protein